jgi:hypothetical protein
MNKFFISLLLFLCFNNSGNTQNIIGLFQNIDKLKKYFFSISFILVVFFSAFGQQYGSFKDTRDGKVYKTVKIGNQEWMAENLNADRFRNGDKIPEARSLDEWDSVSANKQPFYCYFDNEPANGNKYGIYLNPYND